MSLKHAVDVSAVERHSKLIFSAIDIIKEQFNGNNSSADVEEMRTIDFILSVIGKLYVAILPFKQLLHLFCNSRMALSVLTFLEWLFLSDYTVTF